MYKHSGKGETFIYSSFAIIIAFILPLFLISKDIINIYMKKNELDINTYFVLKKSFVYFSATTTYYVVLGSLIYFAGK
jgi:hypothetical protein